MDGDLAAPSKRRRLEVTQSRRNVISNERGCNAVECLGFCLVVFYVCFIIITLSVSVVFAPQEDTPVSCCGSVTGLVIFAL